MRTSDTANISDTVKYDIYDKFPFFLPLLHSRKKEKMTKRVWPKCLLTKMQSQKWESAKTYWVFKQTRQKHLILYTKRLHVLIHKCPRLLSFGTISIPLNAP